MRQSIFRVHIHILSHYSATQILHRENIHAPLFLSEPLRHEE